jgi:hypothetical protein
MHELQLFALSVTVGCLSFWLSVSRLRHFKFTLTIPDDNLSAKAISWLFISESQQQLIHCQQKSATVGCL